MSKLEQAIELAQAGDEEAARQLLGQVLREDPDNKQAWEWLARCTSVEEARRYWRRVHAPEAEHVTAQGNRSFMLIIGGMFAVLLLAVAIVLLVFSGRSDDASPQLVDDSDYVIFYVEGMPCLYLDKSSQNSSRTGITCDWSKWNGPQDGD